LFENCIFKNTKVTSKHLFFNKKHQTKYQTKYQAMENQNIFSIIDQTQDESNNETDLSLLESYVESKNNLEIIYEFHPKHRFNPIQYCCVRGKGDCFEFLVKELSLYEHWLKNCIMEFGRTWDHEFIIKDFFVETTSFKSLSFYHDFDLLELSSIGSSIKIFDYLFQLFQNQSGKNIARLMRCIMVASDMKYIKHVIYKIPDILKSKTSFGKNCLSYACASNRLELVEFLVEEHNVEINHQLKDDMSFILFDSCDKSDIFNYLIKNQPLILEQEHGNNQMYFGKILQIEDTNIRNNLLNKIPKEFIQSNILYVKFSKHCNEIINQFDLKDDSKECELYIAITNQSKTHELKEILKINKESAYFSHNDHDVLSNLTLNDNDDVEVCDWFLEEFNNDESFFKNNISHYLRNALQSGQNNVFRCLLDRWIDQNTETGNWREFSLEKLIEYVIYSLSPSNLKTLTDHLKKKYSTQQYISALTTIYDVCKFKRVLCFEIIRTILDTLLDDDVCENLKDQLMENISIQSFIQILCFRLQFKSETFDFCWTLKRKIANPDYLISHQDESNIYEKINLFKIDPIDFGSWSSFSQNLYVKNVTKGIEKLTRKELQNELEMIDFKNQYFVSGLMNQMFQCINVEKMKVCLNHFGKEITDLTNSQMHDIIFQYYSPCYMDFMNLVFDNFKDRNGEKITHDTMIATTSNGIDYDFEFTLLELSILANIKNLSIFLKKRFDISSSLINHVKEFKDKEKRFSDDFDFDIFDSLVEHYQICFTKKQITDYKNRCMETYIKSCLEKCRWENFLSLLEETKDVHLNFGVRINNDFKFDIFKKIVFEKKFKNVKTLEFNLSDDHLLKLKQEFSENEFSEKIKFLESDLQDSYYSCYNGIVRIISDDGCDQYEVCVLEESATKSIKQMAQLLLKMKRGDFEFLNDVDTELIESFHSFIYEGTFTPELKINSHPTSDDQYLNFFETFMHLVSEKIFNKVEKETLRKVILMKNNKNEYMFDLKDVKHQLQDKMLKSPDSIELVEVLMERGDFINLEWTKLKETHGSCFNLIAYHSYHNNQKMKNAFFDIWNRCEPKSFEFQNMDHEFELSIPDEILLEIFSFVFDGGNLKEMGMQLFCYGSVCKRWKKILCPPKEKSKIQSHRDRFENIFLMLINILIFQQEENTY